MFGLFNTLGWLLPDSNGALIGGLQGITVIPWLAGGRVGGWALLDVDSPDSWWVVAGAAFSLSLLCMGGWTVLQQRSALVKFGLRLRKTAAPLKRGVVHYFWERERGGGVRAEHWVLLAI